MFVSEIYDELVEILATSERAKIFRKLTQAIQVLMESGHYFHINREMDVCTGWDGQTVTLPRGIEVPLAVNVDGSPTYFRGRLFQYSVNKGGMYAPVSWAWDDRGFVATQMDIRQPAALVAVAEHPADASVALRVVGTDSQNRELRTQNPDGSGVDGMIVQVHATTDFPLGVIIPDPVSIETRTINISPMVDFTTTTTHQYQNGQQVSVSLYNELTSTLPAPIKKGDVFFVGSTDENTVQLYYSRVDALAENNPVELLSSSDNVGGMVITDTRGADLYTTVLLSTAPAIAIDISNEVTFAPIGANPLPAPLLANTTYFASVLDETNLLIYENATSAADQDDTYLVLSRSSNNFYTYIRKPITPQTKLTFTTEPGFSNGDTVQAYTNNGVLPQPLIKGQSYYVHRLSPDDQNGCTLHLNYAESITGDNPINLITNGSGQNSIAKLFTATAYPGNRSNIQAPGLSVPTVTNGTGAVVVPLISGPVTSASFGAGGSGYTATPTATFSDLGGTGYTSAPTVSLISDVGSGATFTATISGGFVTGVTVVTGGSNYSETSPPTVVFTGGTTSGFPAKATVVINSTTKAIASVVLQPYGSGAAAIVSINSGGQVNGINLTNPGSGYVFAPRITISGGNGAGGTATCQITPSFISSYRVDNTGSGYLNGQGIPTAPAIFLTGGSGTGATATANVDRTGRLISVTPVTFGTGYSSAPTLSVIASTGVFIQFSTTGTLPAPLVQGAAYRLELPSSADGTFTVKNLDFTDVNITTTGSGTFYVALSRVFGIGFTNIWQGDFNGIANGQPVYFGSDYLLPITSPSTSSGVPYYVLKISQTQVRLYTGYNSGTSVFTGLITVTALGAGQSYYAVQTQSSAAAFSNLIEPYDTQFLNDGDIITFTTSGTLPAPLVAGTGYIVKVDGIRFSLLNQGTGTPVAFTSLGIGQLLMNMSRRVTALASTSLELENSFISDGGSVVFRSAEDDSLPLGLTEAPTTYYARNIDGGLIEVYDTRSHALNRNSTLGRVSYDTPGDYTTSTFYVDVIQTPTLVKTVLHVEKPVTQGYISLYAFDYGRSNDMTLIGQYHPSETNPKYRRIRLGKQCAWVRMMYRAKAPVISAMSDYIPVEHERALIAAVHAVDLEDKDFVEQAQKYWATAITYLRQQNESMDGHAMTPPQINNITYGDGTDEVMF